MGRRTVVLVIAIVLAVVSAFAVYRYLTTVESDIRANITEVNVYRAKQTIDTGTAAADARPFIEPSTALREAVVFDGSTILCTGPVDPAADPVSQGCPDNPSDLDSLLEGKVAAGPISAGQLITADQWITPAELNSISLSESIPQGKVAIGVRPDEVASVGGFIRPGDHVNLVASATLPLNSFTQVLENPDLRAAILGGGFAAPAAGQGSTGDQTGTGTTGQGGGDVVSQVAETLPAQMDFTQTVLQDLEVLAVGADTQPSPLGTGLEPQGSQVVVLEVTPEQAEQIEFARQYTTVALSLLPADVPYTPFDSNGVIVDDLFTLIDRIAASVEATVGSSGG